MPGPPWPAALETAGEVCTQEPGGVGGGPRSLERLRLPLWTEEQNHRAAWGTVRIPERARERSPKAVNHRPIRSKAGQADPWVAA